METTETRIGQHWSLTLLGIGLIVMFAYYGESVLAVFFFAILLSFTLSPVVQALEYLHLPRALAALISMVVLLALLYGVTVASYEQAIIFADNLPKFQENPHHRAQNPATPAAVPADASTTSSATNAEQIERQRADTPKPPTNERSPTGNATPEHDRPTPARA